LCFFEILKEIRVYFLENRGEVMPYLVASIGVRAIGAIFSPADTSLLGKGENFFSGEGEQRAKHMSVLSGNAQKSF